MGLRESVTERISNHLGPEPLVAVAPANRDMTGFVDMATIPWFLAGIAAANLVGLALSWGSTGVLTGIGAGIGFLVALLLRNHRFNSDPTQPGGLYVVLAVTPTRLLVVSRSFLGRLTDEVAVCDRDSIAGVATVDRSRWVKGLVIYLGNGESWQYQLKDAAAITAALTDGSPGERPTDQ